MRNLAMPSRRARTSCSVLALATVMLVGPTPAAAQSFLGSGTFATNGGGVAGITNPTATTTTITVNGGQSVIDWTPTDNATGGGNIAFQLSGTTATFTGATDFAVLNRINQSDMNRAISLNGTINSLVNGQQGGSLYFYSAGGFLLGGNSIINVGSLVLSASPLTLDGSGNFINGTSVTFGQALNPTAGIVTASTSAINANAGDAYVAMIAPNVTHNGGIVVNGSAALVAADAATINFSPDGLFDIQVTSGTSASTGVSVNGGTITGSASSGAGDIHRAYLVAVPKNNALTLLISNGSSLGFDVASAANVVGNTVVLSAGYDVVDGAIQTTRSAGGGTGLSDITVYDTDFTSQVEASATDLGLFVASLTTASMAAGLNLRAADAQFNAFNAGIHQVTGSVFLDSNNFGVGTGQTGGRSSVFAGSGGTINIGGDLTVRSQGIGLAGVSGTGGLATIGSNLGSSISVGGILRLNADGIGGAGAMGLGGFVDLVAGTNSALSAGSLNASADGVGGADAGSGAGNGTGGNARLLATGTESSITIANIVTGGTQDQRDFISVEGRGGRTNGNGSGIGGTGQGGSLLIRGEAGGSIALPNIADSVAVRILSRGYGGNASVSGTTGGLGVAGALNLQLDNATLTAGPLLLSAVGLGGFSVGTGDINGGNAIGGTRAISVLNGSTLTLGLPGGVAGGGGGDGSGTGVGGNASGGTASLLVDNSTVNFSSRSIIITQNQGGTGSTGGSASGGNTNVTIRNGGIVNVADDPLTTADLSIGSNSFGSDIAALGNGGSATAGNVNVALQGGTINLAGGLVVSAEAYGGGAASNGNGGNATGGNVSFVASGGNNSITGPGSATFTANAYGGGSAAGNGGNATGGNVNVSTATGAALTIASSLIASANGFGGISVTLGGNGFGGFAQIFAGSGSSLTIGGLAQIEANGLGGAGNGGECFSCNGQGGFADGGVAAVSALSGGALTFNGNVTVSASATGGSTSGGLGGDALGGTARLAANGGTISAGAGLTLDGSATGGTGSSGGNAIALVSPPTNESSPVAVALYATNGGSITISGGATLDGHAMGGVALNGNGGNAIGGEADVVPFVGAISLGSLSLNVSAQGGNGGNGGNGGSGQGGVVDVAFGLNNAPINGTITLGSATISADGYGGNGGAGSNANFGGNGGAGGAGSGGSIGFVGSAAGGTLNSGPAILTALGTGGQGGAGGNGDSGTGGSGGSGGAGTGGFIQAGTVSQSNSPGSGGGANYSTLTINSSAIGGSGGNGGTGGGGDGAGGNGGNANGGRSTFLMRGVLGTADSVTLMANATGGEGGSGTVQGNGGNAVTGSIAVESKDRFEVPAERGVLNVNSIVGSAIALGGGGATNGTSTVIGGSYFRVLNGDATIGSVSITLSGNLIDSSFGPSFVSVRDGTANIGSFSFVTDGTLALDANNGAMDAASIQLHAADFVPHVVDPAPVVGGTYSADSFDILTDSNFVTTAHLDSVQTLTIVAPGAIQIGNVTGGSDIFLEAQGAEVDIGTVLAGGGIDLNAAGFITTGNIAGNGIIDLDAGLSIGTGSILNTSNTSLNAGTLINVGTINSGSGSVTLVTNNSGYISGSSVAGGSIFADSDGDIFLGNLTAPGDIELVAIGNILVGNALAGESIDLDAGGYIDGGTMTAGDSVYAIAGGSIDLLDISAGIINQSTGYDADYNVGLLAGTTIDSGDIEAFNSIGLGAAGNIFTGTIDAGDIFLALGGGNMSFGSINSGGTTYLADDSMIPLGGNPFIGDFAASPILAATPVVSGGSITLRGPVAAGRFIAAAGSTLTGSTITSDSSIYAVSGGLQSLTDLDAGTSIFQRASGTITENDLTAGTFIDVRSNGAMSLGDLGAGDYIDLRSNNAIGLGNATSGQTINFQTLGTLTGLTITAGNSVLGQSVGAMQLGAITAGITNPSNVPGAIYRVGLASDGNITTGNINSLGNIGFGTPANLVTGNLTSGGGIMALIGGNLTAGSMTTGNSGYVYLANYSMSPLGGAFLTFNRAPILAVFPVATGGSITIGGPVVTGNFRASAGTTFDAGAITSDTIILVDSGGNITLGNLNAGLSPGGVDTDAIRFNSGGNIVFGNAIAKDGIDFDAQGSVTGGNLTTGREIGGNAEGAVTLGNLSAGIVNPQGPLDDAFSVGISSATSISVGNVTGAEAVGFATLGAITTGTINAGTDFLVMATGNMSFGAITAGGRVYLADSSMFIAAGGGDADNFDPELVFAAAPVASGGSITAGVINAGSVQAAAGTTLNVGTISAGGLVDLSSGGAMQTQNITGGDALRLTSGGSITGGNLVADTSVRVSGAGAVNVGNITIVHPQNFAPVIGGVIFDVGPGSPVELFGASIATGNIATDGYVGLYTPGTLTVGTINASHDVIALAGGNASFGAIATPERFLLGGYTMFAGLGAGLAFNPGLAFGLPKTSTGGSATFGGASSASSFQAYVGGAVSLQSLTTSNSALIDALGLFTLGGTLNGNSQIISNDIDIGSGGAVNTGNLQLVSRNATQTVVGDGVTGAGYLLSDAEFDRIHTPLSVVADVSYGAAARMLIGDLTATVSGVSQTGYDYLFATRNGNSATSVGSIKVLGDVTFTGLSLTDEVTFQSNRFELDAATGSINLFGSGTTLGGILGLYAPNVWVASGDILTKLEANARYPGYIAELNAPAAVQRPEGVLRAASIDIDTGQENLQSFLVQNTGTQLTPAGFLINADSVGDDGEDTNPPGSVNLVINGQLITQEGTLTGIAVRDFFVAELGTTRFVAESMINGCPLTGDCNAPPPPPPTFNTVVSTDVQLSDNSGLGDSLFGNEADIAGEAGTAGEGGGADEGGGDQSSPISPPTPLFDTRPLNASDDVNDPASGAGNPSLYGNPDEDDQSDEQKKASKAKKGDGK
ncbi:hypothetical protein [Sphingomonas sp.]|uniref:hypothetical protein n=1 Tax=Sphingomonas sp. TaxID=28214 RepID=UPI00286C5C66|nr:hypothetical protein [Sphingomonas sp.]